MGTADSTVRILKIKKNREKLRKADFSLRFCNKFLRNEYLTISINIEYIERLSKLCDYIIWVILAIQKFGEINL